MRSNMGSCVVTQQPNQNDVAAGLRLAPTKLHQMLIYSKRCAEHLTPADWVMPPQSNLHKHSIDLNLRTLLTSL